MTAPIVGNVHREPLENPYHIFRLLAPYGFMTSGADDHLWARIAEGKRCDG